MDLMKCISLLALFSVLLSTVGPALADEDDEYQKMQEYIDNGTRNHEGVRVISADGEDVTSGNHRTVSDNNDNDEIIKPEDIFSEKKVLGQDVKEGSISDLLTNVKRWVSLLFVSDYITAIVGLSFAAMGILMILLSCGSILKNGISAAGAMLSTDRDAEEKLETVYDSERGTVAVVRGVGVTLLGLSAIVFMVNFLSGM